jgi:hypothetical protein
MNDAKYIGLDVHQATISVAVLDSGGKLVMEAILETKAETILQFIRGLRGSLHVTLKKELALPGCTALYMSATNGDVSAARELREGNEGKASERPRQIPGPVEIRVISETPTENPAALEKFKNNGGAE